MATTSWFNDNQYRDYPFITRVLPLDVTTQFTPPVGESLLFELPHAVIVDMTVIMDIDAGFVDATDYVYLAFVTRTGATVTFVFHTNAANAANYELVFVRSVTDTVGTKSHVYASSITPEPLPDEPCSESFKWSGYLVTGDLSGLVELIPNNQTINVSPGLWQLEPSRVQNLARSFVRSVTLANEPRTIVTDATDCAPSQSLAATDPIIIARCLTGDLTVKEGFNCVVRQDTNNNAIVISAGVGSGAGVPCEEIPKYADESAPDGGSYLSGGPRCDEIVKTINGVGGANITISAGTGFRVEPSVVDQHTLVINRALDDFAQCHGLDTNSSIAMNP